MKKKENYDGGNEVETALEALEMFGGKKEPYWTGQETGALRTGLEV